MDYIKILVPLFCFIYAQRKDLTRHLIQFYESKVGKVFNQIGLLLSLGVLIGVCFVSAVIFIVKNNLSNTAVLLGTGLFMVCLLLIYGIAYLHKDVLYYKKAS